MRRLHPFVVGSVLGGLVIGGVPGSAALNLQATVGLALVMAGGAAIAALVCWRWPGLAAPAWKLWPVAVLANPLFMIGVYWTIDEWECLFRRTRSGWDCLFSDFAPILAGLCLIPPVVGLVVRFIAVKFLSPARRRG
jgi:hypothetical protein